MLSLVDCCAAQGMSGTPRRGNAAALSSKELDALDAEERIRQRKEAAEQLGRAHFVVDSAARVMACIEEIERRLRDRELP